jgi:hypothetical protein
MQFIIMTNIQSKFRNFPTLVGQQATQLKRMQPLNFLGAMKYTIGDIKTS